MTILEDAKNLIAKQVLENRIFVSGKSFVGVQKTYFWTNENVQGSLNYLDFQNVNQALTVLASGDQLFSLISKGVLNVDTFDVNTFSEYYVLGLKKAIILKNNYEEFLKIVHTLIYSSDSEEVMSIIYDHLPYMEQKYRSFWQEILDFNYSFQKQNSTSLSITKLLFFCNIPYVAKGVNYLESPENYQCLQDNLEHANISFSPSDASDLAQNFANKNYDLIILSNILDYFIEKWGYGWHYEKLKEFEDDLDTILNPDGIILLQYIFDFASTQGFERSLLAIGSNVRSSDLVTEIILKVDSIVNNNQDGILLKRGK